VSFVRDVSIKNVMTKLKMSILLTCWLGSLFFELKTVIGHLNLLSCFCSNRCMTGAGALVLLCVVHHIYLKGEAN